MGYSGTNIHFYRTEQTKVLEVVQDVLQRAGFTLASKEPVPSSGPQLPGANRGPAYLLSPQRGEWTVLIKAHQYVERAPFVPGFATDLSRMAGPVLTVDVHDDDVLQLFYDQDGTQKVKYVSNPAFFVEDWKPVDFSTFEAFQWNIDALKPLLPENVGLDELKQLLEADFWEWLEKDKLDKYGGHQPGILSRFACESDRMQEICTLLRLHGDNSSYPYLGWGDDDANIDWTGFLYIRFK